MTSRTNSTATGNTAAFMDAFERVQKDSDEFFASDVVAQREGVYTYPDPDGGVRREFVSTDELHGSVERLNGSQPALLRHPETDEGLPTLTDDPRANYEKVGHWDDYRKLDDGIGGRVFIRVNEVGEHGGDLSQYMMQVAQHGTGEVSTGYDIKRAVPDPGRHNGMEYGFTQQGVLLDHIALLPDEMGDCSVEDGCGLGRANNKDALTRVNHYVPTDDGDEQSTDEPVTPEDVDEDTLVRLGSSMLEAMSGAREFFTRENASISVHKPSHSGTTESSWSKPSMEDFDTDDLSEIDDHFVVSKSGFPPDNFGDLSLPVVEPSGELNLNGVESALQLAGQVSGLSGSDLDRVKSILNGLLPDDRENMGSQEKINQLVEEYGFTREHLTPLSGSECLSRIHEAFVQQESETENGNMGNEGNEGEGGDGDSVFTEEQEERLHEMVEETVEETVGDTIEDAMSEVDVDIDEDELVEQAAEKAAEQSSEVRAHQRNIQLLAQSDEFPKIDEETAERMNEDVVADLAEDVEEESEPDRVNFAGRAMGSSFDEADHSGDDYDISSGAPRLSEGGDD